jgi:PAS domain S-box-containing protein
MGREIGATQDRSADGSRSTRTRWGLPLSLSLYALAAASLAGACLYFFFAYVPGRRAAAIKAWQQELVVRADLRKMTLDDWVAVGLADADILAAYPTPHALIAGGEVTLNASRAADAAAHLREVAERFARMRGYHRFVLLDTSLRIVVGVGAAAELERPDLQAAAEVLAQGKAIVDFHRYADGRVAVVFLARVGADTASRTGGGVVLLEADPSKWLYPYLGLRPIAAASAETLLVKREGDDIVFLSPLRHNPAPPLTFRRPANVTGLAALAAVEGREGFGEYVDYRNEAVFAALARLDRAPWGIVVKVDQREALATYRLEIRRTGATAAFAFPGFWAAAFMLVLSWRRRAEMALGESEGKYRSLVEQANETIYVVQGGRIVFTNRVGAELVGYSEQEIASKPFVEFIHPDDRAMVAERHQRRLKGEELGSHYSFRVIAKNGDIKWVEIGTALISYDGKPATLNLLADITPRKQAEEAMVRANSLLQRTFDAIPDLLTVHDRDLRVVLSNWHGRAHVTEEERNSRPHCYSCYMRRDRPCEPCPTLEVFRTGAPVTAEVVNPHTGKILEVSAHPVTDASGAICLVTEHVRDITERRRGEAALRESEARFRNTFEHSSIGNSLTGPDGRLLKVNQALADMLGLSIEELQQVTFAEITHPDDIAESRECVRSAFAGERATYRFEKRYRHRDGHFVFADVGTTLLRDDQGAPLCLVTSVVDISARKRADEELAAAHSELERRIAELKESQKALVEAQAVARVGSWEWDALTDKIVGSQEFYRLFAVAPEEITRYSQFVEWLHPDDRERVEQDVAKALHLERPYDTDYRVKLRDGGWRDINARGHVFLDDGGKPVRMVGTCLDITERKQAGAALRESERKFRDTVRYLDEGYYSCAVDGVLHEHNVAFNRILGFKPEEDLRGSRLPDFWQNPEGRKEYLSELMSKGIVRNFLINAKTIGGNKLAVMANSHLVKDEHGSPARIEGTFTDFTERKRMEERISHLNLVLKAIRNVNQLIVREKDPETLIRRSCEVLTETRGYFSAWIALYDESGKYMTAASAGLGDAFESLKDRFRSGQLAVCDKAVHECGVHVVRNPAAECPDCPAATLYRGQSAIAVRLEHQGRIHGLLVMSMDHGLVDLVDEQNLIEEVADDIAYALHGLDVETQRGTAEEDLRKHRDQLEQRIRDRTAQLEESNKELEAFSYSVSHDLRAPLRAIDGFTRLLADDYAPHLDTEGKRICSVIHENTAKMGRLIDDLLAFSRLGRAEMSLSRTDMETMANSVFHELTTPESRARIDFQVGALPPALADPTLMRQVWMNLLANAIKFSSKQERAVIKVSAQQNQGESVYVVQDNGAGFEMQYVGKLFGVFQRLHSSKEFEGTGVGLALVQRVIRRHGGRVWAEGEIDKGATFYFALQQRGA